MRRIAIAFVAMLMLGMLESASAATIQLSTCLNADCTNAGFTGSLDVTILEDPDHVQFDITNNTNGAIKELQLSYEGGLSQGTIISGFSAYLGRVAAPTIEFSANGGPNDPITLNVTFKYGTSNAVRFDRGESITFMIGAGLDVSKFSQIDARAHVIELPRSPGSGWIGSGTPVPDGGTTLALLGCSLIGLGVVRRRLRA